jgi:hypothetical protein
MWRLAVLSALASCTPLTPLPADAGADGGGAGGAAGGTVAGGQAGGGGGPSGGGQAGGSAGGEGGGTGGGTGGGAGGGAAPPFTWSAIGLPPNVAVGAIAGRPGELYAVSRNRELLRATGTVFSLVPGFDLADVADVSVSPSGRVVVVAASNWSRVCASGCDQGANYAVRLAMSSDRFARLCGRGEEVYAIAYGTSLGGILYRFINDQWTRVMNDVGVGSAYGCAVLDDGSVLVVGVQGVARFEGVANAEPITLNGQAPRWRALAVGTRDGGAGDAMIVGGFGAYQSARRAPPGTWSVLTPVSTGRELEQVAGFGADEFVALGEPMTGGPPLMHFRAGVWAPLTGTPPLVSDFRLVTSANGAIFLGGVRGGAPVLFRGTRP